MAHQSEKSAAVRHSPARWTVLPWILGISLFAALLRGPCSLQTSEDFAAYLLGRWAPTIFYPGSNRLGNLLPLLTSWPIPLLASANIQLFLRLLAGFSMPALAITALLRGSRRPTNNTLLAISTFLYLIIALTHFSYSAFYVLWTSAHPYSLSVSLFLLGTFLVQSPYKTSRRSALRWSASSALIVSALWVNSSLYVATAIFMAAFGGLCALRQRHTSTGGHVAVRHLAIRRRLRQLARQCSPIGELFVISTVAFIAMQLLSAAYAHYLPQYTRSFSTITYTGLHVSVDAISVAFNNLVRESGMTVFVGECLLAAAFTIFVYLSSWKHPHRARVLTVFGPDCELALLITAAGSLIVTSQSQHVHDNALSFRYFVVSSSIVVLLLAAYLSALIWRGTRMMSGTLAGVCTMAFALLVLPIAVVSSLYAQYGGFSGLCTFSAGKEAHVTYARIATAGHYSAVLGSYWDTWIVTFHAARLGEALGVLRRIVYPTAYRSELVASQLAARIRQDVLEDGYTRLLYVPPVVEEPAFAKIDVRSTLVWNRDWGTLPWAGLTTLKTVDHPLPYTTVEVRPPVLKRGSTITFTTAGNAAAFKLHGWYPPEQFGTWTSGPRSELVFALDESHLSDLTLVFNVVVDVGKFVTPHRMLTVGVLVNDRHITDWCFNPDFGERTVRIPGAVLSKVGANIVSFDIIEPMSGRGLGFNPMDTRSLGFALGSMAVE